MQLIKYEKDKIEIDKEHISILYDIVREEKKAKTKKINKTIMKKIKREREKNSK